MSFVLLLMLSLGILIQVETHSSTQTNDIAQAKANALLALDTAIGELQQAAGPDTRVTATADLLDEDRDFPPGNRFWTGVWKTEWVSGAGFFEDLETVRQWSTAQGPRWLISHEGLTEPDPSAPATALASEIISLTEVMDDNGNSETVTGGLIPNETGAYAFVILDNSLRSDATLVPPADRIDPSSGTLEERLNFILPARSGIAHRSEFANFDPRNSTYWNILERVTDEDEVELVPGVSAQAGDTYLGKYSYDSNGLLTDTRRGGLRKDLTRYLERGAGLNDSDLIVDPVDYMDLPAGASANLPRWGLVRDWYRTGRSMEGFDETASDIAPHSMRSFGLHPLISSAQVRVGFAFERTEPSPGTFQEEAVLLVFPRIDLWNPYNVTLPRNTYILRIHMPFVFRLDDSSPGEISDDFPAFNLAAWLEEQPPDPPIDPITGQPGEPEWVPQNHYFMEFRLRSPALEPGVVRPFFITAGETGFIYERSDPVATPGLSNEVANSYVAVPTGNVIPASVLSGSPEYITHVQPASGDNEDYDFVIELEDSGATLQRFRQTADRAWYNTRNNLPIDTFEPAVLARYWRPDSVNWPSLHDVPSGGAKTTINDSVWFSDGSPYRKSNRIWANMSFRVPQLDQRLLPEPLQNNQYHYRSGGNAKIYELIGRHDTFNDDALGDIASGLYLANRHVPDDQDLRRYVFFEVPRTGNDGFGVLSLGQLQHVPFAAELWLPEFAFGNSWAPPFVTREDYAGYFDDGSDADSFFDLSYLVNESIWDRYFLSGRGSTGGLLEDSDLPSGVHRLADGDLQDSSQFDFDRAAGFLTLAGAFNVNTTSVEAWKDLLRAGRDLSAPVAAGGQAVPGSEAAFSRFTYPWLQASPIDGAPSVTIGDDAGLPENWSGLRALSEDEVDALATAIVEQVRARGPFLSLADFVNRRLVADTETEAALGLKGALQAAIDQVSQPSALDDPTSGGILNAEFNYERLLQNSGDRTPSTKPENIAGWAQPEHILGVETGQFGQRLAGIPGYLTQADVLTVIGPRLSARGDTFTIIAYGEARDPITGDYLGSAKCEAVVQRVADYVNATDAPQTDPANLIPENRTFGRKFELVSFRWLDQS